MVVETMPKFPGGEEAMQQFLMNNLKYPQTVKDKGIEGIVFVSFIVEKGGKISGAKVLRAVENSLDAEALRVVNAMPKWTPGKQKGKTVRVQFNLPISFKLK